MLISPTSSGKRVKKLAPAVAGSLIVCLASVAAAQSSLPPQAQAEAAANAEAGAEAETAAQVETEATAACASDWLCLMDIGNGILLQPATGLEWTQSDNGADITWEAAQRWCEDKGDGWQLPTGAELQALYDRAGNVSTSCGRQTCKVSPHFRLSSSWVWTSDKSGPSKAWGVGLYGGTLGTFNATSASTDRRALCVRRP